VEQMCYGRRIVVRRVSKVNVKNGCNVWTRGRSCICGAREGGGSSAPLYAQLMTARVRMEAVPVV